MATPRCTGPRCFFTHASSENGSHEATLQALNRWMVFKNHRTGEDEQFYYATDNFVPTATQWDVTPLIFAQNHPDPSLVKKDLQAALKSVKTIDGKDGYICGSIVNSRVITEGNPRLSADTVFDDPAIEKMYKEGKVALSSAFFCPNDSSGHLNGPVEPNHVLVFVADPKNQPRDLGSGWWHNQADKLEGNDVIKQIIAKIHKAIDGIGGVDDSSTKDDERPPVNDFKNQSPSGDGGDTMTPEDQKKIEELDAQIKRLQEERDALAKTNKANEDKMAELVKTNKANLDAMAEMKKTLDGIEVEKAEKTWTNLRDTQVPRGWLVGDKAEETQKAEFNKDKVAYLNKILVHRRENPKEEVGQAFTNQCDANDDAKLNAVLSEKPHIPGRIHSK